jgi:hypothetical protein
MNCAITGSSGVLGSYIIQKNPSLENSLVTDE